MENQAATAALPFSQSLGEMLSFIAMGGPAMWAIAVLSVLTVALIL
ncbi:hypothetical protein [Pseudotabrizicola sediminis]|nr:hypothetical protein [Pseudotabrizicola sediminis]